MTCACGCGLPLPPYTFGRPRRYAIHPKVNKWPRRRVPRAEYLALLHARDTLEMHYDHVRLRDRGRPLP